MAEKMKPPASIFYKDKGKEEEEGFTGDLEYVRERIENLINLAQHDLEQARYIVDHLPYHVNDDESFASLVEAFNDYMDRAEEEILAAEEDSRAAPAILKDETLVSSIRSAELFFEELCDSCDSNIPGQKRRCRTKGFTSKLE